jgi:hypothetical protein
MADGAVAAGEGVPGRGWADVVAVVATDATALRASTATKHDLIIHPERFVHRE